jgi:xylose dehydrogenase (NAD/NADP)
MNKEFVNWGIISCAGIADSAVIPAINQATNANLHAISSRSQEKLEAFKAKHQPANAYSSYEEILDDADVDAVYIPLPNSLHYEWAIKAMEKKKHVLCEKPLGCTAEEVLKMKAVAEENGVLLMEAFAYRHSPLTLKIKDLVDSGVIGKPKLIESHFSFIKKDLSDVRLMKSLLGGSTYDVGCYNINLMRFLAGREPVSITAAGSIGAESDVDETCCSILQFTDGLMGVSYTSFNCTSRCNYAITGESGIIEVPVQFNSKGRVEVIVKTADKAERIQIDCQDNYQLEVEQFGRCLLNDEKPLVSMEESYGNAVVIDEILKQLLY